MTPCPSADLLAAYLQDRLDPRQCDAIETHSEGCPACQKTLADIVQESSATFHFRLGHKDGRESWAPSTALLDRLRLSDPVPDSRTGSDASAAAPAQFPQVPGYRLVRVLGVGGMGVVYEAIELDLKRRVALKMLHKQAGDGETLARFRREAESSARLAHPNVVSIYAVGQAEGRPFLALELVEGGSLADRLRLGLIPPMAAATILEQVARGVQCAHEAKIVHRDLKPANILLQQPPGAIDDIASVTPKIADFGLARSTSLSNQLTQTGMLMGTPSYMAPEQTKEKGTHVGPATDIYALGTILYEMLTGRPPLLGAGTVETMLAIVNVEPVPPRRLNPSAPRDLETICLKCLEKDPRRRYASVAELAEDLRSFRAGAPIRARPLRPWQRVWKWTRRHPAVASLLAALAILLAGGGTLVTLLWLQTAAALEDAEEQRRQTANTLAEKTLMLAQAEYAQERFDETRKHLLAIPESHRNADWRRLQRYLDAERGRINVPEYVESLLFSPDGCYLAATLRGAKDNVCVWERASGKLLLKHSPPEVLVGVFFEPDSRQLGVVSVLEPARFAQTRLFVQRLGLDGKPAQALSISAPGAAAGVLFPESKRLAGKRMMEPGRNEFVVWNLDTGELQRREGLPLLADLHLDCGGRRLAICTPADPEKVGETNLWDYVMIDWPDGKPQHVQRGVPSEFRAFTPDLHSCFVIQMAPDSDESTALVFDMASGKTLWKQKHPGLTFAACFSADGSRVCFTGRDRRLVVLDTKTGAELAALRGHERTVPRVCLSPDGRWLASTDNSTNVEPGTLRFNAPGNEIRIWAIEGE